uniref:Uncharacterized protein n=1 Tax=Romanomermis culicivorax TaxID=13658 RepID=A0A915I856_ROMCU
MMLNDKNFLQLDSSIQKTRATLMISWKRMLVENEGNSDHISTLIDCPMKMKKVFDYMMTCYFFGDKLKNRIENSTKQNCKTVPYQLNDKLDYLYSS